jgi:hypothetical protein
VLWKGRVYETADAREFTLAMVAAGTVFGEMALTAQRPQGAYAQATELSGNMEQPKARNAGEWTCSTLKSGTGTS